MSKTNIRRTLYIVQLAGTYCLVAAPSTSLNPSFEKIIKSQPCQLVVVNPIDAEVEALAADPRVLLAWSLKPRGGLSWLLPIASDELGVVDLTPNQISKKTYEINGKKYSFMALPENPEDMEEFLRATLQAWFLLDEEGVLHVYDYYNQVTRALKNFDPKQLTAVTTIIEARNSFLTAKAENGAEI
jgi:hypothetical protein